MDGSSRKALRARAAIGLSLLLVLGGLAASMFRIVQLESGELQYQAEFRSLEEFSGEPGATRVSVRLGQARLKAGEHAVFEVCSRDGLEPGTWLDAVEFVVWRLEKMELMLRVPLDRAHLEVAKRGEAGACLALGGGDILADGRYAVDAVWMNERPAPEVMRVGLQARILGRTLLTFRERLAVIAIALGAVIGVLILFLSTLGAARGPDLGAPAGASQTGSSAARLKVMVVGVAAVAATWIAITWLPLWGSALGLLKGLSILAIEVGLSLWLARRLDPGRGRLANLALTAPPLAPWASLAAAVPSACVLVVVARLSVQWIPATGEAPIQTFVSWPSGMLSFAALGVIVPLGEEVFFRGFLYRAALGLGRLPAFVVTVLLFVAIHAQQAWGNWGGLTALLVTGTVLTALRAWSGSVLPSTLAHLLYNFALSMGSF